MSSSDCPEHEKLLELYHGNLAVDASEILEEHLENCASCRNFLSSLSGERVDSFATPPPPARPMQDRLFLEESDRSDGEMQQRVHTKRANTLQPPCRFGEYELIEEIARGGMGVIYKARQLNLDRYVAIKMILAGELASAAEVRRFYSEAEAAARLDHPGIVPIYEVKECDGHHFFSMAFVQGSNLAKRTREKPLAPREATEMLRDITLAVDYAHRQGVVHRDLKPQNILLTLAGEPKVTDFGLAKRLEHDSSLTATGQVLGTPSYMSPEQAAGRADVGSAADIYSLGAVFYCMLTGRPPFQAASAVQTLRQVIEHPPVPPSKLNPSVPKDLEILCLKCLEKRPEHRFGSARELADELERFLRGEPIRSRPVGTLETAWRWCRRKPLAAGLAAAVCGIMLTLAIAGSFAGKAARTGRLADLSQAFQSQLDGLQVDVLQLQTIELQVQELTELDPKQGLQAKERLLDRLGWLVEERLEQPKFSAADAECLTPIVSYLEKSRPERAAALRKSAQERVSDWHLLVEVQPPFKGSEQLFAPHVVNVQNDGLVLLAGSKDLALPVIPLATRAGGRNHMQLEAVFEPTWEDAAQIGLSFVDPAKSGYSLVVATANSADVKGESKPFRVSRQNANDWELEIRRAGVVLHRSTLSPGKIASGPLRLWFRRERDRLTWQINDLPPEEFFDPFPLVSPTDTFGVLWPPQAALQFLRAHEQVAPELPSALEAADEQYDRQDFVAAQRQYREFAAVTKDSDARQESRYKEGLCFLAMNRTADAEALFEPLFAEQGKRWPVLAGCQLWVIRLKQDHASDAETIFAGLSSRFRFEQLVALAPVDLRQQILSRYMNEFFSLATLQKHNPDRLRDMERAAAVSRLLSATRETDEKVDFALMRAYMYSGDNGRALEIAERLVRRAPKFGNYRNYIRLLRWVDRNSTALEEIDAFLQTLVRPGTQERLSALLVKARVHVSLNQWKPAEDAVAQYFRECRQFTPSNDSPGAFLMQGFMLDRRGDVTGARLVWQRGYAGCKGALTGLKSDNTAIPQTLILGALSGAATDDELMSIAGRMIPRESLGSLLEVAKTAIDEAAAARTLRTMWLDAPGKKLASDLYAFEMLSLQDRARLPVQSAVTSFLQSGAFGDSATPVQRALCRQLTHDLYEAAIDHGTISISQGAPLLMAWKGNGTADHWKTGAAGLSQENQASLAYLLAHRCLQLGQGNDFRALLDECLKVAPQGSELSNLARGGRDDLDKGVATIAIHNEFNREVRIQAVQADKELGSVSVSKTGELKVPAGKIVLRCEPELDELKLSHAEFVLLPAQRQEVVVRWRWKPGDPQVVLSGVVDRPAELPGIGRWQVESRQPRSPLSAIALSNDENYLALGGDDGFVRIHNVASGALYRIVPQRAASLAWRSTDNTLTVGSRKGILRQWNLQGEMVSEFRGPTTTTFSALDWNRDGTLLASGAYDAKVQIWNSNGSLVAVCPGHLTSIRALDWHPQGRWLASAAFEPEIRWWQPDGTAGPTLAEHSKEVTDVAWRPDGEELASIGADASLRFWSRNGQHDRLVNAPATPASIAWRPDGTQLATVSTRANLRIWNSDGSLRGERSTLSAHRVFWGNQDDSLLVFRPTTNPLRVKADGSISDLMQINSAVVTSLSWTTNGQIFASSRDGGFHWFDRQSQRVATFSLSGPVVTAAAISSDGTEIAATGHLKGIGFYRPDGTPSATCGEALGNVRQLAWSPDGQRLAVAAEDRLSLWNRDTNSLQTPPATIASMPVVAWHPQKRLLAVADSAGKVQLLNTAGESQQVFEGPKGMVWRLAWSPDGNRLAAGTATETVYVWSMDGKRLHELEHHEFAATGVAWGPNNLLAVATGGEFIHIWNDRGELVKQLRKPSGNLFNVAWSNDGRYLAASCFGIIQLWNSDTWETEWTNLLLPEQQFAAFTSSGKPLQASEKAADHLVYLVEKADRSLELLGSEEFKERSGVMNSR